MEELVAAFMDVTMCDSRDAAVHHLASCDGRLNDAVGLYFAAGDYAVMPEAEEEVRPPIPTRRERLYDGHCTAARSFAPGAVQYKPRLPPPAPVPYAVAATGWGEDIDEDSSPTEEDTAYVMGEEEAASAEPDTAVVEDDEPAEGEEACRVRVRFPDGRVLCKDFGAKREAAALFRYCHSMVVQGGTTGRPFRLVRLAGGASGEIRRADASFEELGLNHCTVHVVFGLGSLNIGE